MALLSTKQRSCDNDVTSPALSEAKIVNTDVLFGLI